MYRSYEKSKKSKSLDETTTTLSTTPTTPISTTNATFTALPNQSVLLRFIKINSLLFLVPLLSLYFPINYNFSMDSIFLCLYIFTLANWSMDTVPIPILALPPTALAVHSECFSFAKLVRNCDSVTVQTEELSALSAIVVSNAAICCNIHRRLAVRFVEFTETQPQKVLAGVIITTVVTTILFGQMHAVAFLHPIFKAVMALIHNSRNIRLSEDGSSQNYSNVSEYKTSDLSVAVKLALPFAIGIASPAILFYYKERQLLMTLQNWLLIIALPMVAVQSIFLWLFFIAKFFGKRKIWEWKSSREDLYVGHLIMTEKEQLSTFKPDRRQKLIMVLLYSVFIRYIIRLTRLDTLLLGLHTERMGMDENIFSVLMLLFILIYPEERKDAPNVLLDHKEAGGLNSWDVVFFILTSNMITSNFERSALVDVYRRDIIFSKDTGLVAIIIAGSLILLIITNITHTTCVLNLINPIVRQLAAKLSAKECMIRTMLNVTAHYSFLFPISSAVNLFAFSAGGFTKKQMFVCGLNVLLICYVVFMATFSYLIPLFDFQHSVQSEHVSAFCHLNPVRDPFAEFLTTKLLV